MGLPTNKAGLSSPEIFLLTVHMSQGGSSVVLYLCLCVCGFICAVVLICSTSFLLLVHRKNCASCLWHFLDICTFYIYFTPHLNNRLCVLLNNGPLKGMHYLMYVEILILSEFLHFLYKKEL